MFAKGNLVRSIRKPTRFLSQPVRIFNRFNSSQGNQTKSNDQTKSNGSKNQVPPPKKPINGRLVLAVAAVAIGSSIYATLSNKKEPKSAIEPVKSEEQKSEPVKSEPLFSEGKIKVIFVLGGPGSGKGTQCGKLVKDYGCIHLSAGDLLRAEQERKGSKYGELIANCIKDGLIVPQEVTVALLQQAIENEYAKGNKLFLIDGFPRKMDQAITFENQIAKSALTIFFECPEQVMLQRLLQRGKTSGRTDDNIESIKKRFVTFVNTSMPVVEHFEKENKVIKVSCDKPVDEVYSQVTAALIAKGIQPGK